MEYRKLGDSGLFVSQLGLGTNAFGKRADEQTSIRVINAALDKGINFLDTANIYADSASETIIGKALQGKRQQIVLATKAGLPKKLTNDVISKGSSYQGSSRRHLMQELDESLQRLQTDYIDLYQIHSFDPHTPLEETLRTLETMITSGKVRYIGASNYMAWEMMKALGISDKLGINRYISIQQSYSLADRTLEREIMPMCLDQQIGIIPYFPLAGGILTGKYNNYNDDAHLPDRSRAASDPNFQRFLTAEAVTLGQQVTKIAASINTTPAALSLAWLMHQPAVATVIVGATSKEQVEANFAAVPLSQSLSADTITQLDNISRSSRKGDPFASYRLN
ncbi:aldo/keto reductase [Paenibacillus yanchengensis]|uniref:Aldo/keto reductase n=1 Tax=Paenibacillus yanchengensis TaxID=2035833 RepID=A0ABW4YGQ1_9BACL